MFSVSPANEPPVCFVIKALAVKTPGVLLYWMLIVVTHVVITSDLRERDAEPRADGLRCVGLAIHGKRLRLH